MLRTLAIFFGLVLLTGCGVAIFSRPEAVSAPRVAPTEQQLKSAYARVRPGVTPVSQLAGLGFDPAGAVKLSYLGVMDTFMPKDSTAFDALDPAVQGCFEARDQCTAYIFTPSRRPAARVVLLVRGGRVAYKMISGFSLAAAEQAMMLRASLD